MDGALRDELVEEGFKVPKKDIIPELLLLGSLDSEAIALASGIYLDMQVVRYKGYKYVMSLEQDRWFDER